ncbi:MAG TPA: xanthine dehydrogenase family protein molybdopterin-binding subunit [Stellaceae bacterium]|jgi:xanthine dehydrogenase YagR molybdenum-binding subunit|nr:xanthine dehydrogenase family protein molybdopterin-binding subunit [Stellaceae bacterium]
MIDMSNPIGSTPLDRPGGLLGQALDRIDGPLKVTGRATYAYEYRGEGEVGAPPAYGFVVVASIGKGRIIAIDSAAAEKSPGVLLVMTHANASKQGDRSSGAVPQLADDRVLFHGQPVALVVAESFEEARAAAYLVKPSYAPEPGAHDLAAAQEKASVPASRGGNAPDSSKGDIDGAIAAAPIKIDVTYTTPPQSHAMMEPHATIARWDGDHLTLYTANQMLPRGIEAVAGTLRMPKDRIRLVSRYIGGGFGAKLQVQADAILAAMAARMLNRPVKLALTRQQVFAVTTHRSDTIQRLRLAAERDGTLQAVAHESWSDNAPGQTGFEGAAMATRNIYATPALLTAHRLATLDLPVSAAMRAPGEAVGLLALECAMDELAALLGMDPIALRVKNEPTTDPQNGKPFATRALVPCMQKGAELFGWNKRNPRPASVRDGEWLVGIGMSAAIRGNPMLAAKASASLGHDGVLTVRTSMTDIGTGSYTILGQIAADLLGLPIDRVRVELGDTSFPAAPGSGGSFGANSAGSAVYDACMNLREALLRKAGLQADGAVFADGAALVGNQRVPLDSLAGDGVSADGAATPGDSRQAFVQQSYGAHFAEVGVNSVTGEIRLRRMLGVFAVGRVLNAKTARSQAIGGMTFGVGAALMEAIAVDKRDGWFVNNNLAEYHVAANADIPEMNAVFIPETDDRSSAMKSKGIGELGTCGAGAALANAVFNATGIRIRDYPLTLDKVLKAWEQTDAGQRTSLSPGRLPG